MRKSHKFDGAAVLSSDGFWLSVSKYEPRMCVRCEERVAVDELDCCSCCHWNVQAELEEGWPLLRSYLGKWAAFRDWESS